VLIGEWYQPKRYDDVIVVAFLNGTSRAALGKAPEGEFSAK
jgi:hypothetical protein